jgi:hypothetical protein
MQSERSPESSLSGSSLPAAFSGVGTQISSLALALLLGFGLGVTFQAGRDAKISETMALPEPIRRDAAPSPSAKVADAPSAQVGEKAVSEKAATPAADAPPQGAPSAAARAPDAGEAAPQTALVQYGYVYRYEKDGGFGYQVKVGKFENVAAARVAAISECQAKGGRNCKFNFAPSGNCISVARPPSGQYRVSAPAPDEVTAAADARAQCLEEHSYGCRIEKVLCP